MKNEKMLADIRRAEDEVREIFESDENKRRMKYWDNLELSNDYFRAIPKGTDKKPFIVECERPQYAKILGFDFYEYYHDPYLHYLSGLQMQIFKFRHFDDCTPVVKGQAVYPSGAFERSIFAGDDAKYTEHDAVIADVPIIKDYSDLDSMEYPDFYTSGIMPQTIKFYEDIRSIASGDFAVSFPVWGRSAWGCAWQMRRLTNLMYDVADNPEWVARLLAFFNEARKRWSLQKAEYLGVGLAPENIYNDEVLNPVVSPALYGQMILPLEIDLSEFYGGVCYWHSCGDTTALYGLINRIPNVEMVTVSAWSDVSLAGRAYDTDIALEVQMHNSRDVLCTATETTTKERIEEIRDATPNHRATVLAGGLVFYDGYEEGMEKVRALCATAHEVLDL